MGIEQLIRCAARTGQREPVEEKFGAFTKITGRGIGPGTADRNLDRVVTASRLRIDTRLIGQCIFKGGRATFFDFSLSHQTGAASDFVELGLSGLHITLFSGLYGDRT